MRPDGNRLLALVPLLVGLVLLVAASPASAATARVLGHTKSTPDPQCPANCSAVGSVTGLQMKAQGKAVPFKMPRDGKIVAWSVRLSNPTQEQRDFFGETFGNDNFGMAPTARISVLKRVNRKHFRLKAQSPVAVLSSYYGNEPVFTLSNPIRAAEGRFVALTYPTWAPNLVMASRAPNSVWRASRPSGKCGTGAAPDARPHQEIDSVREYGCRFTDRLLYWAYYVAA